MRACSRTLRLLTLSVGYSDQKSGAIWVVRSMAVGKVVFGEPVRTPDVYLLSMWVGHSSRGHNKKR